MTISPTILSWSVGCSLSLKFHIIFFQTQFLFRHMVVECCRNRMPHCVLKQRNYIALEENGWQILVIKYTPLINFTPFYSKYKTFLSSPQKIKPLKNATIQLTDEFIRVSPKKKVVARKKNQKHKLLEELTCFEINKIQINSLKSIT